ncbi:SRPBCC family protein [Roseobacter sinensis]|uniref:SRPBCC family protein n=1 Tax=Roseobacter sinensis TaxID=2931391 RepID=A0ABT3BF20_9RHOB|nr:SRPBCC family protein [Roseobacter sp. WL0113]MCV3271724.1 SRPBCC family protein [Roseobacter sp. WL0113]
MKFSTQEVMEVPADAAFALLTDFALLEQAAVRRGADVRRLDSLAEPGVGQAWDVTFAVRGRPRQVALDVVIYRPPQELVIGFSSQGLEGETRLELTPLSPSRTRVMVSLEMRPATLPGRLLLQSLKLAKVRLAQRYKVRVGQHIEEMEQQHRGAV